MTKDYEKKIESANAFILIANLRRLAMKIEFKQFLSILTLFYEMTPLIYK
ncbi:hypothetical protein Fleli_0175 [Bernardetia litoralis DSM 6794]|uniref:Uncharacterized protein n=1 Tax=Bernardetia litoralis (strain ATCC 23117 / DSM 6794 / NBRC 15988 / NCIMB 1366 / Fx l1 / Sio-4) TaxID=880071 RepID=I4AFD9_BERLS|nr:hypothetical protein Fleli_0175 [Bernardetia litoralis DSM 6794]